MNSLRARWTLAFALAALVPLVIVMVLLASRIRATVRAEASARLEATLGVLRIRLRSDRDQIERKLELLGRDPTLKRLYLVPGGGDRDLLDFLATQRFLLGLDFLAVIDTAATSGPNEPALSIGARAPVLYLGRPVAQVRGGVTLNQAYLEGLRQTSGVELVLRDTTGRAIASTLGGRESVAPQSTERPARVRLTDGWFEARDQQLDLGEGARARITALLSTASADRTIGALQATCAVLGLLSVALAALLGAVWSWQLSRPVERLANFATRMARGESDPPLEPEPIRELETLVRALDRMRGDLAESRARLQASERQAAWSQMARAVAHEIKNPLTPIAVSVADLKRSYELHRPDFAEILNGAVRTIDDEVLHLKRLLNEFSALGSLPPPTPAACSARALCEDLGALYGHEIAAGRLAISAPADDPPWRADRGQIRQALVNLVKNGLEATEPSGHVRVAADADRGAIEWVVADDGPGLDESQKRRLFVPEFTTKPGGSGLGLTIVERIASDHGGAIRVESEPGRGTSFHLRLPLQRGA